MRDLQRLRVEERSQVAEARRFATAICRSCDFGETRTAEVAIVVTEMATNLVKHAGGGQLLLRRVQCAGESGIEVLALDQGPGIANPGESLADGRSTAGSPGTGLGAIRRLSSVFDLYSVAGKGTAVFSRVWKTARAALPPRLLTVGAVCVALEGEDVCGDTWAVEQDRERALLMVADGLGHGLHAAEAATKAAETFRKNAPCAPEEMVDLIHRALASTRGAAVAVAEVARIERSVRYAGVGNISGRLIGEDATRNLVSHNGTAGMEVRKIQEFSYPWPAGALLVLFSDGMGTHWTLDGYPGLRQRHPVIIAGVLFRDHARGRDDCVVVVAKPRDAAP